MNRNEYSVTYKEILKLCHKERQEKTSPGDCKTPSEGCGAMCGMWSTAQVLPGRTESSKPTKADVRDSRCSQGSTQERLSAEA